jgi:hypothetical protein
MLPWGDVLVSPDVFANGSPQRSSSRRGWLFPKA